jgi:hypothetical protein
VKPVVSAQPARSVFALPCCGPTLARPCLYAQLRAAPFRHEGNLHKAVIKLTDFGRAVPFAQLQQQADDEAAAAAAGGSGAAAAAGTASFGGSTPLQYNKDGLFVFGNPQSRPPEVRC